MISRLSAWFSGQADNSSKPKDLASICLLWILLQPASHEQWQSGAYRSCIDRIRTSISIEKGVRSVASLTNTHPKSLTPFGISLGTTPESSPDALLVHVDADACSSVLAHLRGVLNHGGYATNAAGLRALRFSISIYTQIQAFSPRSARNIVGSCKTIVAIDPSEGQEQDIDAWYRKEQLPLRAQTSPELFLRCDRYTKIVDPSIEGHADNSIAAPLLAVHEYVSRRALIRHCVEKGPLVPETDWTRKIHADAKSWSRTIWKTE